jgi:DNA primase
MPERVTIASLPRSSDLDRQALMGFLQFGHRLDPDLVARAGAIPVRHPALEAVRQSIVGADMTRPGWATDAIMSVREPYRSLAAELLTGDFPARDDLHAVASSTDLARRIVTRELDREKADLRGAIQRVRPESDEARALNVRMRDLELDRRRLLDDQ